MLLEIVNPRVYDSESVVCYSNFFWFLMSHILSITYLFVASHFVKYTHQSKFV